MTSLTGLGTFSWAFLCSVLLSDILPNGGTGPAKLKYFYYFRSGEKITVTPSSKELLFYPPSMEATVSGGRCPLIEPVTHFGDVSLPAFKHLFFVVVPVKVSL